MKLNKPLLLFLGILALFMWSVPKWISWKERQHKKFLIEACDRNDAASCILLHYNVYEKECTLDKIDFSCAHSGCFYATGYIGGKQDFSSAHMRFSQSNGYVSKSLSHLTEGALKGNIFDAEEKVTLICAGVMKTREAEIE